MRPYEQETPQSNVLKSYMSTVTFNPSEAVLTILVNFTFCATLVGIIATVFTCYVIIQHSPSSYGGYKWMQLNIVLTALCFNLSYIIGFHYPTVGFFAYDTVSIFEINNFWANLQFSIYILFFLYCAISMLVTFYYFLYILSPPSTQSRLWKMRISFVLVPYLACWGDIAELWVLYFQEVRYLNNISRINCATLAFFYSGPTAVSVLYPLYNWWAIFFVGARVFDIIWFLGAIAVIQYFISRSISSNANGMDSEEMREKKQMFYRFLPQTIAPIITVVIPYIFYIGKLLDIPFLPDEVTLLTSIGCLHSLLTCVLCLLFPYQSEFLGVLCCKKRTKQKICPEEQSDPGPLFQKIPLVVTN